MASSIDRAKEAEKHLAEAKKCLKTGLLKWSPDYDYAANHFEKAAMCFRNLRSHAKAKEAFEQAADAYLNNNALFHSAKALEQAAGVARDSRSFEESAQLFGDSSLRYNESGHPDTAALILEKAAKMLQHDKPVLAADFFLDAADLHSVQEKYRGAALCIKDALRMYCRSRQSMDKVIETAQKARKAYLRAEMVDCAFEAIAVELVALMHSGNTMNAREVFQEAERNITSFSTSVWNGLLDRLLEAVGQQDTDEIHNCCNSGHFKALDSEFAKLARDLEGRKSPVKQAVASKTSASSGAPKTASKTTSNSPVKVVVGKKNPKALADMRSQLFSKSSASDSKKSRVDTSPELVHKDSAATETEEPKPVASLSQSERSQDAPENIPQTEEEHTSSVSQSNSEEDDDEPLDLN